MYQMYQMCEKWVCFSGVDAERTGHEKGVEIAEGKRERSIQNHYDQSSSPAIILGKVS